MKAFPQTPGQIWLWGKQGCTMVSAVDPSTCYLYVNTSSGSPFYILIAWKARMKHCSPWVSFIYELSLILNRHSTVNYLSWKVNVGIKEDAGSGVSQNTFDSPLCIWAAHLTLLLLQFLIWKVRKFLKSPHFNATCLWYLRNREPQWLNEYMAHSREPRKQFLSQGCETPQKINCSKEKLNTNYSLKERISQLRLKR